MFQGAEQIRDQRPRWRRSSLSECEGFKCCCSKWELGAGKMLGKLSGFRSHHRSHGEPVTMSSSPRPALLTPVSLWSSIRRDLEKISPKSGLNYRLRLSHKPLLPQLPRRSSSEWRSRVSDPLSRAACPCFNLKDRLTYGLTQPFYSGNLPGAGAALIQ